MNAKIFDGEDMHDGLYDIAIRDEKIVSIAAHSESIDPKRLKPDCGIIVDADGAWIMPGLIDLHVHLTWNGGPDPAADIVNSGFPEHLIETVSNALKYLPCGITSVRDLGSPEDACLYVGRATNCGKLTGPRIFGSGMSLIMTGGHDPFHGMPVDGRDEALKGVRIQVAKGASVIKISATGGVYGREDGEGVSDTELRPEELQMIVDEAHRRNIRVTAHAIGETGVRECLKAGIDCIEHGHFITEDMAEIMYKQGTAYVPTLYIYRFLAENEDIPAYARKKSRAIVERHRQALESAMKKGVLVGAGSDAGSPCAPHPSLFEEMSALSMSGMSIQEVLRAATSNAGEILGLKDKLGVIREGAAADMMMVPENPLENLQILRNPAVVIARGRIIMDSRR
jgi:imidazolonepropionase-like amidohydrolase